MLIDPRSGAESVDRRLAKLNDPELDERLRLQNPHLFRDRKRRASWQYAVLAFVGILSLLAGYAIESAFFAPGVKHIRVVQPSHHHHASRAAIVHPSRRVASVAHTVVLPARITPNTVRERIPARAVAPAAMAQARAHVQAVAQAKAAAEAQTEAKAWLRAEAQARAEDRARAVRPAAVIVTANVPSPPETATGPITIDRVPTGSPPSSGNPFPRLPGGGGCHRGGIAIGGHGLGSVLLNVVLRSARIHGSPLLGRP